MVLVISNVKGLLYIIQLLQNKLYTPKFIQLNNLIKWLNENKDYNLKYTELCKRSLINNAWLSGFIEADGCFFIRLSKTKRRARIGFRCSIDQIMKDPITGFSYESILSKIDSLFYIKLYIVKRGDNLFYFRLELTSQKTLLKLFEYFAKYPLWGVKSLDFYDFKKSFDLYKNSISITEDIILEIENLKKGMNNSRTYFELEHFK